MTRDDLRKMAHDCEGFASDTAETNKYTEDPARFLQAANIVRTWLQCAEIAHRLADAARLRDLIACATCVGAGYIIVNGYQYEKCPDCRKEQK